MAETIEIAITSRDVLSLKQSCEVIINEYKRHAGTVLVDDENGIYPMLLDQVKGLRVDVEAGKGTLDNFEKLTLDEMERPTKSFGQLDSYKDIENITGNYTISQSVYDEAQAEVKDLFNGLKHREAPKTEETKGSGFRKDNLITKTKSERKKYSQSLPIGKTEETNPDDGTAISRKVLEEKASGAQTPSSLPSQTASFVANSKGKFPNTLLEECIPCDFRLNGLDDLNPSLSLLAVLEDLKKQYEEVINKLKSLLNNTEIADDICSLLNFLDFQCLPDLYSLIVLLSTLMNKYRDIIPSLDGAFMQFIGPFFSPLLSGFNELLDKFIAMIMNPIDCVLNALDTQLSKIDIERALDVAEVQNLSFHRKREGYLRRKIEALEERRSYLVGLKEQGADGSESPPSKIGGRPRSSQSNVLRDFLEADPATGTAPKIETSIFGSKSIDEEIGTIDGEDPKTIFAGVSLLDGSLGKVKYEYERNYGPGGENNLEKLTRESQIPGPNVIGNTRGALRDARQGLSSSLYELRNQVLNGRRMVNDTLRTLRDELQRLILGRAATSEEMMEGARNIQRVARLIGVVKTLIKLADKGKLCDNSNGDPSVALGSFLTANRGTDQNNNYYNVYIGQNDGGDSSLLIAPSDAVLELADPETEKITQLDNLDEIDKLNRDGIPVDVGDLSNKKVTASVTDLGFQVPVSVIEFNLCRGSNLSTKANVSKIEDWAVGAGFSI